MTRAMAVCPPYVPACVSARPPLLDRELATVDIDWRPPGSVEWLGCRAGADELADVLRDCGAVEVRQPGVEDGRSALAVPIGANAGWIVQIRAAETDGVIEQLGALGAAAAGPRGRIAVVPWSRPAYIGSGWVVRRLRAADVLGQWAGAGALPALNTTAFLAPEPEPAP